MDRYHLTAKKLSVACLALGLMLAVVIFAPIVRAVPVTVTSADHNANVTFSTDDTTVLMGSDCVVVNWSTEHIRSIEVDGKGAAGAGKQSACADQSKLKVTYQDGTSATLTLVKQVRMDNVVYRLLLVLMVVAFGLAVIFSGLLPTIMRRRPHGVDRPFRAIQSRFVTVRQAHISLSILLTVVAITLIGSLVRTTYLTRPLENDEGWSYLEFASQPLSMIVKDYRSTNNHIFHSLLVHVSTSLFGLQLWTLRLPVFFAGILLIAASFAVGRRFYNVQTGLVAAGLVAGTSWLIEYSVNARGYSLVTFDFLLMLLLASTLRRRRKPIRWLIFALLGALGVYTVPIALYPIVVVCTWLMLSILLENQGRERWLLLRNLASSVGLMGILTGVLYLPAYLYVQKLPPELLDLNSRHPILTSQFYTVYSNVVAFIWDDLRRGLSWWWVVLLIVGLIVSVSLNRRVGRTRLGLVAGLLGLPPLIFVQMATSYDRLWLFLVPFFAVLSASGLVFLWNVIAPRFLRPTLRWAAIASLLVTVQFALIVVSTNSIEMADSSNQPRIGIGIASAMKVLSRANVNREPIVCIGACKLVRVYSMIAHLPVSPLPLAFALPKSNFYVINVGTEGGAPMQRFLEQSKLTPKNFALPTMVMSFDQTAILHLSHTGIGGDP